MDLHRTAQKVANVNESYRLILTDAIFPEGFSRFVDSLVTNGIVGEDWTMNRNELKYHWCDDRDRRGVMIETNTFPTDKTSVVNTVVIEGIKPALDVVQSVLQTHNVCYSSLQQVKT